MKNRDIGYLIKSINDKLKVRADAELKDCHLTLSQSRVLAFLNSCGGQATQKEIEDFMEVSHPTVVGIVTRMEQNGHVVSWIDPKDRRNKIVQITEQSAALGRDMQRRVAANEKRMLESLSEEDIETLTGWLITIYDNLNRYEPE
ncbi:MarR family winged helix-turn-helix transcriptional regulator [Butyricicoccus sp.]|uniref:MarR family winged helix-turn-helix transcriptional regulator n=1 Tax=Butyricicoccus sp. TaxID=2049021 RepID=UPI003F14641A